MSCSRQHPHITQVAWCFGQVPLADTELAETRAHVSKVATARPLCFRGVDGRTNTSKLHTPDRWDHNSAKRPNISVSHGIHWTGSHKTWEPVRTEPQTRDKWLNNLALPKSRLTLHRVQGCLYFRLASAKRRCDQNDNARFTQPLGQLLSSTNHTAVASRSEHRTETSERRVRMDVRSVCDWNLPAETSHERAGGATAVTDAVSRQLSVCHSETTVALVCGCQVVGKSHTILVAANRTTGQLGSRAAKICKRVTTTCQRTAAITELYFSIKPNEW